MKKQLSKEVRALVKERKAAARVLDASVRKARAAEQKAYDKFIAAEKALQAAQRNAVKTINDRSFIFEGFDKRTTTQLRTEGYSIMEAVMLLNDLTGRTKTIGAVTSQPNEDRQNNA